MDDIFSCRNCIHNAAQTLVIGSGVGFCLLHKSMLVDASKLTCKYLKRKDLPFFITEEGEREHAYEFAIFTAIVDTESMKPAGRAYYSEKHAWLNRTFDPLTKTLANVDKIRPTRLFIESFAGGADGRHSLAYASVVRRYMNNCDTWRSSYRFILALVQEMPKRIVFEKSDLIHDASLSVQDAVWDLFFVRLSGLQEYGFHSGQEELIWASDGFGGGLTELNWKSVSKELINKSSRWIDLIIEHAQSEGEFFPDRQWENDSET